MSMSRHWFLNERLGGGGGGALNHFPPLFYKRVYLDFCYLGRSISVIKLKVIYYHLK